MNNTGVVNDGSILITKQAEQSEKDLKDVMTSFENIISWIKGIMRALPNDINGEQLIGYKVPVVIKFADKQFMLSAEKNCRTNEIDILAGWYNSAEDYINNELTLNEARIVNQNMSELEYMIHNQMISIEKGSYFDKPEVMRTTCRKAESVIIKDEIEIYRHKDLIPISSAKECEPKNKNGPTFRKSR